MKITVESEFKQTCAFRSLEDLNRGAVMERIGIHGNGRLINAHPVPDPQVLVVAWEGYGENPGSRYSGLWSYYNAETAVYVYDHTDQFGRRRYVEISAWQTKPGKNTKKER